MALSSKSMFLYGFEINALNSSIDFKVSGGGPELFATLRYGYYSLTGLMSETARAMQEADQNNEYTVTADRTIGGGLQNRVNIESDGVFLSILFGSGTRAASSVANEIGFLSADYTGATDYTGSSSAGTPMVPTMVGYNFLSPDFNHKVFGAVNVSASGVKEAIVYNIQKFTQVQCKFEPKISIITNWLPFMDWAIQQRPFEFTPEIASPTVFYDVTLERTGADGKGLAYQFNEQLPDFPNHYDIGLMQMRVTES